MKEENESMKILNALVEGHLHHLQARAAHARADDITLLVFTILEQVRGDVEGPSLL